MVPQLAVQLAATLEVNCCVAFSATLGCSGAIVNGPEAPIVSDATAV
jgi:3-oxoacyl-[acyl-carrier-protein] synthase III